MVGLQRSGTRSRTEPDRTAAIALAVGEANPGDIVLIAGKGHEKVQITRDGSIPFDDVEVAQIVLRDAGYGLQVFRTPPPEDEHEAPASRIAEFVSATGEFDHKAIAQAYSIDSRAIKPGELFFRGQGRAHGWSRFVQQALEKGAVGGSRSQGPCWLVCP